jgi:long-chain acyl-CoA synthetase
VLPISHIVGISLLIMTLMVGGTVRLVSKYDPAALAKAMAEEGITILNGVPATYQRLLEYKAVAGLPQTRSRRAAADRVAGAPLDLDLKSRVEKEFGLPLFNGYGITECSPGISGVRFDAPRSDRRSERCCRASRPGSGRSTAFRWRTARSANFTSAGRNVMRGYYRAPDLTAKAIDPRAGSIPATSRASTAMPLYRRPHQGNDHPLRLQRLSGRDRGGAQHAHSDVVQCAVVGRAVDGNEEVVAFVQLMQGLADNRAGPDGLRQRRNSPPTSGRPKSSCSMRLPATSTGKILKHKLAESRAARERPAIAGPA